MSELDIAERRVPQDGRFKIKALKKEELKQMADNKKTKTIKKGEIIFKEGERLGGVFCVRNGNHRNGKGCVLNCFFLPHKLTINLPIAQ